MQGYTVFCGEDVPAHKTCRWPTVCSTCCLRSQTYRWATHALRYRNRQIRYRSRLRCLPSYPRGLHRSWLKYRKRTSFSVQQVFGQTLQHVRAVMNGHLLSGKVRRWCGHGLICQRNPVRVLLTRPMDSPWIAFRTSIPSSLPACPGSTGA